MSFSSTRKFSFCKHLEPNEWCHFDDYDDDYDIADDDDYDNADDDVDADDDDDDD